MKITIDFDNKQIQLLSNTNIKDLVELINKLKLEDFSIVSEEQPISPTIPSNPYLPWVVTYEHDTEQDLSFIFD